MVFSRPIIEVCTLQRRNITDVLNVKVKFTKNQNTSTESSNRYNLDSMVGRDYDGLPIAAAAAAFAASVSCFARDSSVPK